jgi:ABC-type microcin C transport system permease subunit YejE
MRKIFVMIGICDNGFWCDFIIIILFGWQNLLGLLRKKKLVNMYIYVTKAQKYITQGYTMIVIQ